jgi:hypothetical protein
MTAELRASGGGGGGGGDGGCKGVHWEKDKLHLCLAGEQNGCVVKLGIKINLWTRKFRIK